MWAGQALLQGTAEAQSVQAPMFQVDPLWPKPLPNAWRLGSTIGVWVDAQDHVWIIHRSSATLGNNEKQMELDPPTSTECCIGAPPVLAFDQEGNLLQAWGAKPGDVGEGWEWPESNHGIFVDQMGNVWIGGNGPGDSHILKFTQDGTFLAQYGRAGARLAGRDAQGQPTYVLNSHDPENFGRVAKIYVDSQANEAYLADGYLNKRVAVIDANTGQMKRFWGAYGNVPDDNYTFPPRGLNQPPPQQFRNPVHCAMLSNDGFVYVCDRQSDRVQVFTKEGTFVKEAFFSPSTLGSGSTWDIAFSRDPEQRYIFLADGVNEKVRIVLRETLEELTNFGAGGRQPGQFYGVHSIATDSQGNIYTTETYEGKRLQKFVYMGMGSVAREQGVVWPPR
ncbi:MAG: hypothetical protein HY701_08105 [Gemmatimonadetes bacterium]|nr:hypothetical protein [Gemmatimonadota bacterium]